MAVLTATPLGTAGVTVSGGAAAGASGDQADNSNGDVAFVVNNGSGSPITVTKVQQATGPDGAVVTNPTISVPAGAMMIIGPFQKGIYNDAQGLAKITYSATATVTVKAIKGVVQA